MRCGVLLRQGRCLVLGGFGVAGPSGVTRLLTEGWRLAGLAFHDRVERVGLLQRAGAGWQLLSVLLELSAVAVLVLQCALEVFLEPDDHGPLLLHQPPELRVVAGRVLLVLPQGQHGGLG